VLASEEESIYGHKENPTIGDTALANKYFEKKNVGAALGQLVN
jgi:hypothetical protein